MEIMQRTDYGEVGRGALDMDQRQHSEQVCMCVW